MSSADRLVVPLNSMCSMKWEMPFTFGVSRRAPVPIQTPMLTERTCGTVSVMIRMPLGREVRLMSRRFGTEDAIELRGYFSFSLTGASSEPYVTQNFTSASVGRMCNVRTAFLLFGILAAIGRAGFSQTYYRHNVS